MNHIKILKDIVLLQVILLTTSIFAKGVNFTDGFFTDESIVLETIEINGIGNDDITAEVRNDLEQIFRTNHLQIKIQGESDPVAEKDSAADTDTIKYILTADNPSGLSDDGSGTGTEKFTITNIVITKKQDNADFSTAPGTNATINVSINFCPQGDTNNCTEIGEKDIQRHYIFPNVAPSGLAGGSALYKKAVVKWDKQTSAIQYLDISAGNNDNKNVTPEKILVLRIGADATNINVVRLEAGANVTTAPTTTEGTCTVSRTTDGCATYTDACSVNCTTGSCYIDHTKQDDANVTFEVLDAATNDLRIYDQELGQTFHATIQFQKGTTRSSCLAVTTTNNNTMSELNGDPTAELRDSRCFIVSATYNSPFAKHVDMYRWFRDQFLLTNKLGTEFVDFYYDHSQPLADVIKGSPVLQIMMQIFLFLPTICLYVLYFSWDHLWLSLAVVTFLLFLSAAYVYRKRHMRC